MSDCNPTSTPADISIKLVKPKIDKDNISENNIPYKQAIGSLTYLMLATRPDISAAVNKVAQFASAFSNTHWTAVKRIF